MTQNLTRRSFVAAAAGATASVGLTGSAAAWWSEPEEISLVETFDGPRNTWWLNADVSDGMTSEDWNVSLDGTEVTAGSQAARFDFDATAGHGTVWMDTIVPVDAGYRYDVEASFDVWSPDTSDTSISTLHAYLGPSIPQRAEDFPTAEEVWRLASEVGGLERPLWQEAGWSNEQFFWETPEPIHTDYLSLAIGVSSSWETHLTHYVDDVRVELTPK